MKAPREHPDYGEGSIRRISRTAHEIRIGECDGTLAGLAEEFGLNIRTLLRWADKYREGLQQ